MKKLGKVLLVYPDFPRDTYWSFNYALRFIDRKAAMPPLGLVTLAAFFPKSIELKLVDMNVQTLDDEDIRWADAVFVSAMIVQRESMEKVIKRVKGLDRPVIVGGPYPTTAKEPIEGADHVLAGEVEDYFDAFLADYTAGRAKPLYRAAERPDIKHSRLPRFDLLDMKSYATMSVQYSRGCPFSCEFCDIWQVYGRKPRQKSAETLVAELEELYRLGWRGAIFVVDDNFIGNRARVKGELLPGIIEWQKNHKYPFRFLTEASVDLASDDELMKLMSKAGFNEVFLGIETPHLPALKETGKQQNVRIELNDAVARIQSYGLAVTAGFIVGFDSDPEDIFDRQIEFIQHNGIVKAMVGMLTPLPGTALYDRLKAEGRLLSESSGNNTHSFSLDFRPVMDVRKLQEGYKHILNSIYDARLKNYFARCNRLIDRLSRAESYLSRDVKWFEVKALFRSLMMQPFRAYGLNYVKFLLRNVLRHPSKFADAVTFAIVGHHFHTITRETLKKDKIAERLDELLVALRRQLFEPERSQRKVNRELVCELSVRTQKEMAACWRKISKLHEDFRHELSEKYRETALRIDELFQQVLVRFDPMENPS